MSMSSFACQSATRVEIGAVRGHLGRGGSQKGACGCYITFLRYRIALQHCGEKLSLFIALGLWEPLSLFIVIALGS
jgi:hypothetical protein